MRPVEALRQLVRSLRPVLPMFTAFRGQHTVGENTELSVRYLPVKRKLNIFERSRQLQCRCSPVAHVYEMIEYR